MYKAELQEIEKELKEADDVQDEQLLEELR
jgi:hypothetical protein